MKKIWIATLLFVLLVGFVGCGKEPSIEIDREIVSEDSFLQGKEYSVDFQTARGEGTRIGLFYSKYYNGNEYIYKGNQTGDISEDYITYFNGSDTFVYTNKEPNGTAIGEYVWIKNMENPLNAIERDIFAICTDSNVASFKEHEASDKQYDNMIESTPFFKEMGFDTVKFQCIMKEDVETPVYYIDLQGMKCDALLIVGTDVIHRFDIPEITNCHELNEYDAVVDTSEDAETNQKADGYYYADGTFDVNEKNLTQDFEYYVGGVLLKSYDYETDTLTDYMNNITIPNYFAEETSEGTGNIEDEDFRYAGELLDNCTDYYWYVENEDAVLTMDSTLADCQRVEWGCDAEWFDFDNCYPSCTNTEFIDCFEKVFNTFSIQYMLDNYNDFDHMTQICIMGIVDDYNFTIDGKKDFRQMLSDKGIAIDKELINEYVILNTGSIFEPSKVTE